MTGTAITYGTKKIIDYANAGLVIKLKHICKNFMGVMYAKQLIRAKQLRNIKS